MSPDLGTPGYGIRLNDEWYRQTLSHNTVLIDGASQPPCHGALRRFTAAPSDGMSLVDVEACWANGSYAGVSMRRWILWRGDYWVDLFRVRCRRPRQIDWVYHNRGRLTVSPDRRGAIGSLPGDPAYGHLADVAHQPIDGQLLLTWQTERSRLDVTLLQSAGAELITAMGPYNPAAILVPAVVVRQVAKEATIAAVFCPAGLEDRGRTVSWVDGNLQAGGCLRFLVSSDAGQELWEIRDAALPDPAPAAPGPPVRESEMHHEWQVELG
jgi:hypothetical protein